MFVLGSNGGQCSNALKFERVRWGFAYFRHAGPVMPCGLRLPLTQVQCAINLQFEPEYETFELLTTVETREVNWSFTAWMKLIKKIKVFQRLFLLTPFASSKFRLLHNTISFDSV
uniref:Uncharacterized protein n=1 Tax=Nelumbo nucifera TaxID=4432 RepID=A0A822XHT3_NELNU|nr:TPA_asm: hypothetical protein HUJ06_021260 [Nelumbo nucifera]